MVNLMSISCMLILLSHAICGWPSITASSDVSTTYEVGIESDDLSVERQTTDATSTWAKLQVSDDVIGHMDYDNYAIKIYGHNSNKDATVKNEDKKYYFEPSGQLNHLSARSSFNNISQKAEMSFRVEMWSEAVRNAVHKFISSKPSNNPVDINYVRVLPLEKVMIYTPTVMAKMELSQDWIEYKSDKFLTFKYVCDLLVDCNDLATQMKTNPEQFNLKMRFTMSSQRSQTKDTKITIDSLSGGEMMNKLDQKFKGKEVLLTASDKKQLLKETSTNILIQTFDDFDVPSVSSQDQMYKILESLMNFSSTTIRKGDELSWDSVFWNEENYRPDKSAKTLNELYNKVDSTTKAAMASTFSNTNKVDAAVSGGGAIYNFDVKLAADLSRAGSESKDKMEALLKESKDRVEWDGIKFVPKQMELSRLNVARLSDKQAFRDVTFKVSYTTSILTVAVRINTDFVLTSPSQLTEMSVKLTELASNLAAVKGELQKQLSELVTPKFSQKDCSVNEAPNNCNEIKCLGQRVNGFFMVRSADGKKVEVVYCDFSKAVGTTGFEKRFGYNDVRSVGVYFHARLSSNVRASTRVPWGDVLLNRGNGLNSISGIFTAPVGGVYYFMFSVTKFSDKSDVKIGLRVRDKVVARAYNSDKTNMWTTISTQAIVELNAGDWVDIFVTDGTILAGDAATGDSHSVFSGWLIEEDLRIN